MFGMPLLLAGATVSPAEFYGAWVFVPPLVTIVLAIWWRQVIPALVVGVLIAGYMLTGWQDGWSGGWMVATGITTAVEQFLIGALADADHQKIIVFTLTIGGLVGIVAANGGTAAIVGKVARWASNRRRGQLATWFAGLLVFFDDYANAMIIGPSMRPVCDRLRISRAKLAYIVDSTAAPVASIAIIGTWIGTEVGYIDDGLKALAERPAFLTDVTAYGAFLSSIPYRFYPILALVFVMLVGLFDRDFGPMLHQERSASATADARETAGDDQPVGRAWYAGVPVLVLVVLTLGLLLGTGWWAVRAMETPPTGFAYVQEIVKNGDSYNSILYGALAATAVAVLISLGTRSLRLPETMDAMTGAMGRMLPTIIVLVFAWTLSSAMTALELGPAALAVLRELHFDLRLLPVMIFVTSAFVSFATGTSWGTMGILCPATVTIAAGMLADTPPAVAHEVFYAAVGAVLAGAVFGDHCSPISDTTVLSSLASACPLETHVWTQMPYALVVAAVALVSGDALCRFTPVPAWGALLVGSALLVAVLFIFGRPSSEQQRLPFGHPDARAE